MPHTSHARHTSSSGDDLGSTDEVKVFKDEGDREDEKISSENLLEEKSSLIDLTESEEKSGKISSRSGHSPVFSKVEPHTSTYNMGYLVSPYPYSNGSAGGLPVSMSNKIALPCFFSHNGDHLSTPPPAHCGIPPYQLDKSMGLSRPTIYPFPSSQYPYPMISPDMSQVATWHTPSIYSAASSFRSPYPSSLPINTTLSSDFSFRFSPSLLPSVHASQHILNPHAAIVTSASKQECNPDGNTSDNYLKHVDNHNVKNVHGNDSCKDNSSGKRKPHIKKPLNAFMLYMKEMRAKVVAECTLKESAAINQILGRRWHELSREEQSKYYEKARQERQLHMELYPGWSARDNYGYVSKKKKRKKDRSPTDSVGNSMKKCRARFGLDQQNQWCKPCKRKKKCIRYMESIGINCNSVKEEHYTDLDDADGQRSDDDDNDHEHMGSCDSGDDNTKTYEDDNESVNHSLSSPSGFASFQSPPTSGTSPAISQHIISSINSSVSEQNHTHRKLHVLQTQDLPLQHQNKVNQQFQPSIPGSGYDNSGLVGINTSSISNLMSTLSASPSTSSVSRTCYGPTSSSANTCPTTLPTTLSDRMMRSLLNSSPAMILGNRLSHLAMGLAMNNNTSANVASNGLPVHLNIRNEKIFIPMDHLPKIEGNISTTLAATKTFTEISNTRSLSGTNNSLIVELDRKITSPTTESSKSPPTSASISLPVTPATEACHTISSKICSINNLPIQRSPIGANPRDINNPLSINQLTKRPHEDNTFINHVDNSCGSNSKESSVMTPDCHVLVSGDVDSNRTHSKLQQAHSTIPLPIPSHSAIFNNSFSQHFQYKFNNHMVSAAVATSTSSLVPSVATKDKTNSISSGNNHVRPSQETTTTNESGAINVT